VERVTAEQLLQRARSRLQRLSPADALTAQLAGVLLVDVRTHHERVRDGVIPGSLHIPRTVLEWRLDPSSPHRNPNAADFGRRVVVVCTDGYSSSLAAAALQELGHEGATDVIGGFRAWRHDGLPVVAAPPEPDDPPGMGAPFPVPELRG
jgi:rhodanese-related sulfurtransferase